MSRESLAKAENSSNLEMESGVVHDVDRLTAMASGNVLGGLLLRLRESGQMQWARRVALILAKRVRLKFPMSLPLSIRVAVAALEEFLNPHCVACNGARVLTFEEHGKATRAPLVCEACEGSGKQRFDNGSRRQRIGTYGRRIDDAMADCHKYMADSLGAFTGAAAGKLA